ncbi:hypothetical protein TWF281_004718 [Arthrobotrys megalospora]
MYHARLGRCICGFLIQILLLTVVLAAPLQVADSAPAVVVSPKDPTQVPRAQLGLGVVLDRAEEIHVWAVQSSILSNGAERYALIKAPKAPLEEENDPELPLNNPKTLEDNFISAETISIDQNNIPTSEYAQAAGNETPLEAPTAYDKPALDAKVEYSQNVGDLATDYLSLKELAELFPYREPPRDKTHGEPGIQITSPNTYLYPEQPAKSLLSQNEKKDGHERAKKPSINDDIHGGLSQSSATTDKPNPPSTPMGDHLPRAPPKGSGIDDPLSVTNLPSSHTSQKRGIAATPETTSGAAKRHHSPTNDKTNTNTKQGTVTPVNPEPPIKQEENSSTSAVDPASPTNYHEPPYPQDGSPKTDSKTLPISQRSPGSRLKTEWVIVCSTWEGIKRAERAGQLPPEKLDTWVRSHMSQNRYNTVTAGCYEPPCMCEEDPDDPGVVRFSCTGFGRRPGYYIGRERGCLKRSDCRCVAQATIDEPDDEIGQPVDQPLRLGEDINGVHFPNPANWGASSSKGMTDPAFYRSGGNRYQSYSRGSYSYTYRRPGDALDGPLNIDTLVPGKKESYHLSGPERAPSLPEYFPGPASILRGLNGGGGGFSSGIYKRSIGAEEVTADEDEGHKYDLAPGRIQEPSNVFLGCLVPMALSNPKYISDWIRGIAETCFETCVLRSQIARDFFMVCSGSGFVPQRAFEYQFCQNVECKVLDQSSHSSLQLPPESHIEPAKADHRKRGIEVLNVEHRDLDQDISPVYQPPKPAPPENPENKKPGSKIADAVWGPRPVCTLAWSDYINRPGNAKYLHLTPEEEKTQKGIYEAQLAGCRNGCRCSFVFPGVPLQLVPRIDCYEDKKQAGVIPVPSAERGEFCSDICICNIEVSNLDFLNPVHWYRPPADGALWPQQGSNLLDEDIQGIVAAFESTRGPQGRPATQPRRKNRFLVPGTEEEPYWLEGPDGEEEDEDEYLRSLESIGAGGAIPTAAHFNVLQRSVDSAMQASPGKQDLQKRESKEDTLSKRSPAESDPVSPNHTIMKRSPLSNGFQERELSKGAQDGVDILSIAPVEEVAPQEKRQKLEPVTHKDILKRDPGTYTPICSATWNEYSQAAKAAGISTAGGQRYRHAERLMRCIGACECVPNKSGPGQTVQCHFVYSGMPNPRLTAICNLMCFCQEELRFPPDVGAAGSASTGQGNQGVFKPKVEPKLSNLVNTLDDKLYPFSFEKNSHKYHELAPDTAEPYWLEGPAGENDKEETALEAAAAVRGIHFNAFPSTPANAYLRRRDLNSGPKTAESQVKKVDVVNEKESLEPEPDTGHINQKRARRDWRKSPKNPEISCTVPYSDWKAARILTNGNLLSKPNFFREKARCPSCQCVWREDGTYKINCDFTWSFKTGPRLGRDFPRSWHFGETFCPEICVCTRVFDSLPEVGAAGSASTSNQNGVGKFYDGLGPKILEDLSRIGETQDPSSAGIDGKQHGRHRELAPDTAEPFWLEGPDSNDDDDVDFSEILASASEGIPSPTGYSFPNGLFKILRRGINNTYTLIKPPIAANDTGETNDLEDTPRGLSERSTDNRSRRQPPPQHIDDRIFPVSPSPNRSLADWFPVLKEIYGPNHVNLRVYPLCRTVVNESGKGQKICDGVGVVDVKQKNDKGRAEPYGPGAVDRTQPPNQSIPNLPTSTTKWDYTIYEQQLQRQAEHHRKEEAMRLVYEQKIQSQVEHDRKESEMWAIYNEQMKRQAKYHQKEEDATKCNSDQEIPSDYKLQGDSPGPDPPLTRGQQDFIYERQVARQRQPNSNPLRGTGDHSLLVEGNIRHLGLAEFAHGLDEPTEVPPPQNEKPFSTEGKSTDKVKSPSDRAPKQITPTDKPVKNERPAKDPSSPQKAPTSTRQRSTKNRNETQTSFKTITTKTRPKPLTSNTSAMPTGSQTTNSAVPRKPTRTRATNKDTPSNLPRK